MRTVLLSLFVLSFLAGAVAPADEIPDNSKYLLLDSRIVEQTEGVALRLGTVEKEPRNPLFAEDKPWEVRYDNMYPNVIFDEEDGIYKCWYSPFIIDKAVRLRFELRRARLYAFQLSG